MKATGKSFRKRNAILECLQSTDTHPSAEQIHQRLKETYPDLSLGTVYRNLTLFRQQGLVRSIGTVGGVERFDGETRPHAHFICTCCGQVTDLHQVQLPQSLVRQAAKSMGGEILESQLVFSGICENCRETALKKEETA